MSFSFRKAAYLGLIALVAMAGITRAQDNTPMQRINVMSDKLDRMKRSLGSAITVLRQETGAKKDDEKNPGTPIGRLVGLEKDVSRLSGDVANLRGKVDRGDKYERSE